MSLYYIRHGETDWNKTGKLQGRSDIPLNDTGRKQAADSAEQLKEMKFDKIYCSPLLRAKETAEIINTYHQAECLIEERLQERSFGKWEGTCIHKEQFDALWFMNHGQLVDGLEGMTTFYNRVQSFLKEIEKEAQECNILLVAHGGVYLPCYCYFHDVDMDQNLKHILIGNCAIEELMSKKSTISI